MGFLDNGHIYVFNDNSYLDIIFVYLGIPLCTLIPIYHCYSFIYAYKLSKIKKMSNKQQQQQQRVAPNNMHNQKVIHTIFHQNMKIMELFIIILWVHILLH